MEASRPWCEIAHQHVGEDLRALKLDCDTAPPLFDIELSRVGHERPSSRLGRSYANQDLRFDIFGCVSGSPGDSVPSSAISNGALSLLQDEEGKHCSSFPVPLLQILELGSRLAGSESSTRSTFRSTVIGQDDVEELLKAAQRFDPSAWATSLLPSDLDIEQRMHIASAHQAAVCIYLIRALDLKDLDLQPPQDVESLVGQIKTHLAFVSAEDTLFVATAWPAFVAAAEAKDEEFAIWATEHFERLWQVEPWGLIKGALVILDMLWKRQRQTPTGTEHNWVTYMREKRMDWLIL